MKAKHPSDLLLNKFLFINQILISADVICELIALCSIRMVPGFQLWSIFSLMTFQFKSFFFPVKRGFMKTRKVLGISSVDNGKTDEMDRKSFHEWTNF